MGGKSRIVTGLTPELRAELDDQIADGRKTIDDLKAWLDGRGHDNISRSAVHRYVLSREDVIAKIRESREMAQAIGAQLGADDGDGSRNAQLMEMLQVLVHGGMMKLLADPEAEVTPGDLAKLAKTLQAANSAQKLDVDRRINDAKLKAAKDAIAKAAEVAKTTATASGMSDAIAAEIERRVLGLA